MARSRGFVFLGILICVIFGGLGYARLKPASIDSVRYWQDRIALIGGGAAYVEAKESVSALPVPDQHTRMHVFGEALYGEEGIAAFSVCDDQFSYGCAHQFIGMAINDHGLGAIARLARACADKYGFVVGGCIHAMGHGILSYFGYDRDNLNEALDACDEYLNYNDITRRSCYWGVFMEYNARRMLSADGDARPVPPENPYTPCDEFFGMRGEACYFILPRWWWWDYTDAGKTNQTEIFLQLASRCERSPDEMHDACVQGIAGTAVFFTSEEPEKRASYCRIGLGAERDQVMCIQHVALWLARYLPTQHGNSFTPEMACESLKGGDRATCLEYASAPSN